GSRQLFADAGRRAAVAPGELSDADIDALRTQVLTLLQDKASLRQAIAPFLSEAKYEDYEPQGDELTADEIREALASGALLRRDPASRCLYTLRDGQPDALFINGQEIDFPPALAGFVKLLADHRRLEAAALSAWTGHEEAMEWLAEQLALGYWFLDSAE
ncbi:MAG TPA: winged helix domain-containing protein, partial [Moraxellaceae bacterium]